MESCWLIEFDDGYKIIISEEYYKEEVKRNWAGRKVVCEAHWFDYRKCRKRNRGIPCFGDFEARPNINHYWTCIFCGFPNSNKHEVCERCGTERNE